jgi:carbon-monoxide dehydrogenase medium subunit
VKPAPFEYRRPESLAEAVELLKDHPEAAALAGGQSLLALMNMRLSAPSHVIDITGLDELRGIREEGGSILIGALTRHAEIESSDLLARKLPLLTEAARGLAHPAIRNRGTIGGSLALADPAAELPACVLAFAARLHLQGPAGTRTVAAEDFFRGAFETARQPSELIAAIEIPGPAADDRYAYEKLARRHGDYALAGIAARARVEGGKPTDLRIAVFGVGDRPTLAGGAASILSGQASNSDVLDRAVASLAGDLIPVDQPGTSGATKLHLAGVLLRRVAARLCA